MMVRESECTRYGEKIQQMFATVIKNAPLFNQSELSKIFLNYDPVHLIREVETILLPGSVITIQNKKGNVLEVVTDEYPSIKPLYMDERFVNKCDVKPNPRICEMPTPKKILETIATLPKLAYIWGGNTFSGIPELLEYYPPMKVLSAFDYNYWQLKGVDCSGLLYALTNGSTPRNSSQIYNAYLEVPTLKPLDIIVWPGHMLIYLPNEKVIESRQYDGVVISCATKRLREVEHHHPKYVRFI